MTRDYLTSAKYQFAYHKNLGEATFAQLTDSQLFERFDQESNSIANIVMHLWGNMLSRWTDFLDADGEKPWRQRDAEFEVVPGDRAALLEKWEQGWACLYDSLNALEEADLEREVLIRNEPHSVVDAINRQLAHYPYHVGQIVFIGKMFCGDRWKSLSIPKGGSQQFNANMFSK